MGSWTRGEVSLLDTTKETGADLSIAELEAAWNAKFEKLQEEKLELKMERAKLAAKKQNFDSGAREIR